MIRTPAGCGRTRFRSACSLCAVLRPRPLETQQDSDIQLRGFKTSLRSHCLVRRYYNSPSLSSPSSSSATVAATRPQAPVYPPAAASTLSLTARPARPAAALAHSPFTMGGQTRSHGHSHGHGHGHHHHHHDTTYLTSKNKQDPGVRITRIGLLANLAMAIGKGVGGYVFHSQALVADAYHALADLVSDFMTLGTVSWSNKPPSSHFPLGYGKIETLGSLGVSGLLLVGGVLMGLNAAEVILTQFFPDIADAAAHMGLLGHGHSHGHSHSHFPTDQAYGPNINAAWLAAGSIVVKEWLYHATMKIAKERKSSVLASNAVHHRVDSLTSIVALLTIGGAHVFSDATWLDPVGGLLISIMIIKAGFGNTRATLLELADAGVEESMVDSVRKYAAQAIATLPDGTGVELRNIQGVKSGPNYLMEVDLAVPGSWSVSRTREVERVIRERVGARVRGVKRLRVRFTLDTEKELDFAEEFIAPDVSPRSSPEPEPETNGNGTIATGSQPQPQVNGHRRQH
ncbi:mitochondrial metal transporter 2 [Nannizzia gypsea CBS 118893]|uniref:Mitochondrial metal transporter 2 n=1 Tax=Arthroderma gypseum (strain ATCC MYA-4604 / CBS 118893) TaxID=535722 RepID=E4UPK3_ARTGP|nr:mitochondrial metal transporter 2 [Nannizzia gypsea CBS 118893]EFQ99878.1 mitochondrial metal transporter 2 [Nannizzia gypsea CBS 118893]